MAADEWDFGDKANGVSCDTHLNGYVEVYLKVTGSVPPSKVTTAPHSTRAASS